MTAGTTSEHRGGLALNRLDLDRLARPALGLAIAASGLMLFHLTRGSSFWADDWLWIVHRRATTLGTFFEPYNGHLSLVPIAIYRLMFAVFGIGSYTPYRALVIALSLVVAVLVFVYARTRTSELVALLLAGLMLFLGPGWQNTMWAFQIPWLLVSIAGISTLMLLERRTERADAAACALLVLAIASTGLALAVAIGIAVDLALTRRRWRDAWVVGIPLALYAIWAVHYHPTGIDVTAIPTIPLNLAEAAAVAMSSLAGLSGILPFDGTGTSLVYGWPLLVVGLALVLWRARSTRPSTRCVSLAATFAVFVASVSIVHGELASVLTSRYIYVYCLLAVLLVAEFAQGLRPSLLVQVSLCALTLAAVVSNIGNLRAQGAYIRDSGAETNGALTALDLDRGSVDPHTIARIALWQFLGLKATDYYTADRALGSPAYSVAQLRRATMTAQTSADGQLRADGDVALSPAPPLGRPGGTLPTVVAPSTGAVAIDGACVRFTPPAALAPGAAATLAVRIGAAGLSVSTGAAPATLSVRRFSPAFLALGDVAGHRTVTVRTRRDAAPDPWYLQLSSLAPVRVCGLPS